MNKEVVYKAKDLVFYLYQKKVIVCTKIQCFSITYEQYQYGIRMDLLKEAILRGEVQTISELAFYCTKLKWESCNFKLCV